MYRVNKHYCCLIKFKCYSFAHAQYLLFKEKENSAIFYLLEYIPLATEFSFFLVKNTEKFLDFSENIHFFRQSGVFIFFFPSLGTSIGCTFNKDHYQIVKENS